MLRGDSAPSCTMVNTGAIAGPGERCRDRGWQPAWIEPCWAMTKEGRRESRVSTSRGALAVLLGVAGLACWSGDGQLWPSAGTRGRLPAFSAATGWAGLGMGSELQPGAGGAVRTAPRGSDGESGARGKNRGKGKAHSAIRGEDADAHSELDGLNLDGVC